MSKKKSHLIILFFDLLCIGGLWIGYHESQRILSEIANHVEVVRFSNRLGFFIVGLLLPAVHLLIAVNHFWPNSLHRLRRLANPASIFALLALLFTGFMSSSWIISQVEDAGYMNCPKAGTSRTFTKSLVYTKDLGTCQKMEVAKKR